MAVVAAASINEIYTKAQTGAINPGDVIEVSGWNMGDLTLDSSHIIAAPGITIRPASGYRPVFSSIRLNGSKGITFSGFEVLASASPPSYLVHFNGTERCGFKNGLVRKTGSFGPAAIHCRNALTTTIWNVECNKANIFTYAGPTETRNSDLSMSWVDVIGAVSDGYQLQFIDTLTMLRCRSYDMVVDQSGPHPDNIQLMDVSAASLTACDVYTGPNGLSGGTYPTGYGQPQGIFGDTLPNISLNWCTAFGTNIPGIAFSDAPNGSVSNCFLQGWGPDANGFTGAPVYWVRGASNGFAYTDVQGPQIQIILDGQPSLTVSLNGSSTTYTASSSSINPPQTGFTATSSKATNDMTDVNTFIATRDAALSLPALSSLAVATPATKVEGTAVDSVITFTITRTGNTTIPCRARWAVTGTGGNPVNAADFADNVLPDGFVAFDAGETSKTVSLNLASDSSIENDETMTLTLSAPYYCTLGTATAVGTVSNDDYPISPSLKNGSKMSLRVFR